MDKILEALKALGTKLDTFISAHAKGAETDAKVKEANDLVAASKVEIINATKAIADRDAEISDLKAKLEKAQGEVNSKGTEITNLKADLEKEKKRTDETLASMGVDPKAIPAPPMAKKDEFADLKGLAKSIAIHKKQTEGKK